MTKRKARARKGDLQTSHDAAKAVNVDATRDIVRAFAINKPNGFIDEELILTRPDMGPSDLRSRRKELTRDHWIIMLGDKRKNHNGRECFVWRHRNYVENPPPIIMAGAQPARKTRADLEAEINYLQDILASNAIDY